MSDSPLHSNRYGAHHGQQEPRVKQLPPDGQPAPNVTGLPPLEQPTSSMQMPAKRAYPIVRGSNKILEEEAILPGKGSNVDLVASLAALEDHELLVQADWRELMFQDHRFTDGQQIDPEAAAVLRRRGQPDVVYNWILPRVQWMTGTERRSRVDFKVLPRTPNDQASTDAETKTQLLKYVSDVNDSPLIQSAAAKEAFISGLSWLELGIREDPDDEPLYERHEHWWNILHDSTDMGHLGEGMRYLFRRKALDLDVALAIWPEWSIALKNASHNYTRKSQQEGWYLGQNLADTDYEFWDNMSARGVTHHGGIWSANPRQRVLTRETWHYVPVKQKGVTRGGSTFDRVKMQLMLTIWVNNQVLERQLMPYDHNVIPFIPLQCYHRFDGAPYGIVRNLIGPSEAFNRKASKAVYAANSKTVLMESQAIDPAKMTMNQLREEVAKPNAFLVFAQGSLQQQRVKIVDGAAVAQGQVDLMRVDMEYIQTGSGVNADNLGLQGNATSGIAIDKRQREGQVTTTEAFDNIHAGFSKAGKVKLALIEQFYLRPRQIRLDVGRGKPEWLDLNQFDEEQNDYRNDLTKFAADFVLDEQAWRASLGQAAMENLWELLSQLAQVDSEVVLLAIDLVVDLEPNLPPDVKQQFLTRLREARGLPDPSKAGDPEEIQKQEDAKQEQLRQQQLVEDAQTAKTNADKAKAEKDLSHMEVNRAKATQTLVASILQALEIAKDNGLNLDQSQGADEILAAANFPGPDPIESAQPPAQPGGQPPQEIPL